MVSWDDARDDFLCERRARGCKPKTVRTYHSAIVPWMRWCEGKDVTPSDCTARHVRGYLEWRAGQVSPHTLYSDFIRLKVFFRFCKGERYIKNDPFRSENPIHLRRPVWNPPQAPTEAQARRLLEVIEERWNPAVNPKAKYQGPGTRRFLIARDRAICLALIETGARIGEILQIRPEHILRDEVDEQGRARRRYERRPILRLTKTKNGHVREVPVSMDWMDVYDAWWRVRGLSDKHGRAYKTDCAFITLGGYSIEQTAYTRLFGKYAEMAGMGEYTPHDLRRMRGTAVGEAGGIDLGAELLGHSSLDTFNRYYRVRNQDRLREAWERSIVPAGGKSEPKRQRGARNAA